MIKYINMKKFFISFFEGGFINCKYCELLLINKLKELTTFKYNFEVIRENNTVYCNPYEGEGKNKCYVCSIQFDLDNNDYIRNIDIVGYK